MKIIIIFIVLVTITTNAFAGEAVQPFSAVCKDIETHAFRYATDINGKTISNGFTSGEGEKIGGEWKFKYAGGDHVIIDGNKAATIIATAANGTIILATEGGTNALAVSGWSYAIHLKLKRIVASEVNAYSTLGDGVKARSVNLECHFE